MTAMQAYYAAITLGYLPATIAITHNGEPGLATQAFPVFSEAQREIALHPDRIVRARAALFAVANVVARVEADQRVEVA